MYFLKISKFFNKSFILRNIGIVFGIYFFLNISNKFLLKITQVQHKNSEINYKIFDDNLFFLSLSFIILIFFIFNLLQFYLLIGFMSLNSIYSFIILFLVFFIQIKKKKYKVKIS